MNVDSNLRQFLDTMRTQVIKLRSTQSPLPTPTNVRVTPQSFANLIQWTRVPTADFYEVLWSATANVQQANIVDVGNSAQWTDNVGQSAIKRWYWVRARLNTGARSLNSPAVIGTTLASGTGVTPPIPPPPSKIIVIDTQTGNRLPYTLDADYIRRGL